MDIFEALRTRRSTYVFSDAYPDLAAIELALDLAILAPNHHRTRPWRFSVIHKAGRDRLADTLEKAAARMGRPVQAARRKAFEAPVIVFAGVAPQIENPKVVELEETLAVAAAIQNFMLALHASGIGSIWTTSALINSVEIREFLEWETEGRSVIGMIYVGLPANGKSPPARDSMNHRDCTQWIS